MEEFPCYAFRRNPDGSWTTTQPVVFQGPQGQEVRLAAGQTFREGVAFAGINVVELLNRYCT